VTRTITLSAAVAAAAARAAGAAEGTPSRAAEGTPSHSPGTVRRPREILDLFFHASFQKQYTCFC
jgi:hypothetical protein